MRKTVRLILLTIVLGLIFRLDSSVVGGAAPGNARPCSSLVVRTDKTDYAVGETVNITVSFVSLIPGCVLPMIVDDYLVKVEVLNVANQTLYSSSHTTARSLNMSEPWTPTMAGEDTIVVSAYFRLPSDESVMWEILETSTEIHVHEPVQTTPAYDKAAAGALGVVVVVGLLFLRRRKKDYQREHAVLS